MSAISRPMHGIYFGEMPFEKCRCEVRAQYGSGLFHESAIVSIHVLINSPSLRLTLRREEKKRKQNKVRIFARFDGPICVKKSFICKGGICSASTHGVEGRLCNRLRGSVALSSVLLFGVVVGDLWMSVCAGCSILGRIVGGHLASDNWLCHDSVFIVEWHWNFRT